MRSSGTKALKSKMADPSTTPKKVEVPKVVPMKESFWDMMNRASKLASKKRHEKRVRDKAVYENARNAPGKTGKYDG